MVYCGAVYSIPLAEIFIIEFNRYFAKAFSPIVNLTSHTLFCPAGLRAEANIISEWIIILYTINIIIYPNYLFLRIIISNNVCKNVENQHVRMTFWSELKKCYAFYILPKCIRNIILSLKSIGQF